MSEPLSLVSPSLIGAIRRCGLAVKLTRDERRERGSAPSSPAARLGNAAHGVLASVANEAATLIGRDDVADQVRARWRHEVEIEAAKASQFSVERANGRPERWPGFFAIQERLVIEAKRVIAELAPIPQERVWVERPLVSTDIGLQGTPDLVVTTDGGAVISDYKTGKVGDDDVLPSGRYGAQLLLYAALVRAAGTAPMTLELRPLARTAVQVQPSAESVDRAVAEASATVDDYNAAAAREDWLLLARPSEEACTWCPQILRCPAIWAGDEVPGLGDLGAVDGVVESIERSRVGSVALRLAVTHGTKTGEVSVAGLDERRVEALRSVSPGDRIRVAGPHRVPGRDDALHVIRGGWVRVQLMTA